MLSLLCLILGCNNSRQEPCFHRLMQIIQIHEALERQAASKEKSFSDFSNIYSSDVMKICAFTNIICHGFCSVTWTYLTQLPKEHWKLCNNDSFTYPVALTLTYHIDFVTLGKELQPPWSRSGVQHTKLVLRLLRASSPPGATGITEHRAGMKIERTSIPPLPCLN